MAKEVRNGKRKRRENFAKRIPSLGYYCIVTDTDKTEENYIKGLRDSLPKELQERIVIKVFKSKKTNSLVKECKEKSAMLQQYSQPWIIFDRDKVPDFDNIVSEARCEGINVGWSNPCIEIWFNSYFGKMRSCVDSVVCCRNFSETYQKKTGKKYSKADKQIYHTLCNYGNEEKAIELAEGRLRQHLRENNKKPSDMIPCTTVHRLVAEIKRKGKK